MKKLLILLFLILFSILISYKYYGFFGLFEKTVCVDTDAQEIYDLIYLPNETKPFTGSDLCKDEYGQILSEGKVNNGKITSQTKYEYHENGQIESEENYKDGKEDGKWTWWYKNGKIKGESNYKDGKLDGKDTEWSKYFRVKKEKFYKDDEPIDSD